ncbi:patatin-like phospholipase family protein [Stenotrophomonas aracearum]|jgi:NTE family protein|uniref:Patatin-like phospholipase family protein n=1 Tax=Stenotrophomonas aracearum TaxID=3003272 RepID=A0ABY9Y8H9_9GAMM|nr:patatin-like phospholipase family protein [Stenotrophomonas sp. A5588]WNH47172.1 patatin-like phospholipase family protein [Stenotrophomonas sp. A5588]
MAMKRCLGWLLLALPGWPGVAWAAEETEVLNGTQCGHREPGDTRPRIGVALGGGGARGIAHVRILRQLEALHIPVDCIAGTSAGALVGALYASGKTPEQIEKVVLDTNWMAMFSDTLPRRERSLQRKGDDYEQLAPIGIGLGGQGKRIQLAGGMAQGERLIALFETATGGSRVSGDFDDLSIPFRAIATDLNTGEAVILDHGSLPMAMRASMSLPGIFRPITIGDRVLLDGGVSNQVPIDVVRAMGADRVIAVDVGTPLTELDRDASLVDVIGQLSGFLTTRNAQRQLDTLGPQDLLISPPLTGKVATGDFDKAPLALEIGQQAADTAAPALRAFSQPDVAYQRWYATREQRAASAAPAPIAFIEVENHTRYADALLLSYLPVEIGKPLDSKGMQEGVLRAYGMDTLASIGYQETRRDGRVGVVITAYEKPNGPAYLEAGLRLSNDLDGNHESNLRAGLLFAPLSPYGAEARVTLQIGSEPAITGSYYHPFDVGNRYAFEADGGYETRSFNVFDDYGNKTSRYRVQRTGASVDLVRNVSNVLSLRVGLERFAGNARMDIGSPQVPRTSFDEGAITASATYDNIDSIYFPRNGFLVNLGTYQSQKGLGADERFGQIDLDAVGAFPIGSNAVQLGLRYHVTASGTAPLQNLYRLGGRWRLAGFQQNELTGQDYALAFAGYTYELGKVLGRSAQLGGTVEYGNAWQRRSDMSISDGIWNGSLFLGFDSWIGPLIFGVGMREGGHRVVFIELGQSL